MKRTSTKSDRARGLGGALLLLCAAACGEEAPGVAGKRFANASSAALTTGGVCSPTAAHPKHAFTDCKTCHLCKGVVQFDPAGAAVASGQPAPAFDAGGKTCSSVACHGVPAGTFTYSAWDWGLDQPYLVTVFYGGGPARPTPSWNATGAAGCTACHDNPPRNGSSGSNVWHSGHHANQGPTGAANQCQFCHPDAYGVNGVGTTITNAALHANGVVNVQASYQSTCFGCH